MSRVVINNKSVAPYYDQYDSTKHYTQLLAVPGRVAQAREISEIQSTVKDIIKSLGDSILKEGNIIEGCQIIINPDKTVTVSPGKVYIQGMVLPVAQSTVPITGNGDETIGVKLVNYLITEIEDPTLKDPAQGYDNYNQPGCHRIQSEVIVVVNDISAATIALLRDGQLAVERYAPEYDILTQTLARRTYDESGSYIVEGLNIRTEESAETGKYTIVAEAGKAYVLGYELKLPTARRISAQRSNNYANAPVAAAFFESGKSDYLLYSLPHVRDITRIIGTKEITEQLTINSNTARNALQHSISDMTTIVVKQGSKTYQRGVDFQILAGDPSTIEWLGTSNYPELGSSYTITYRYLKEYIKGTDYELVINAQGCIVRWLSGGDTPEDKTSFNIDYSRYLARRDVVYIDMYGEISILEGVPAVAGREVAPEAPLNTLTLAMIDNPPNGSVKATVESEAIQISNVGLTRFTMNDIQTMLNRLKTMEYDQAALSLNDEARNDSTANKKGIWTDPLIDLSRIDLYYNRDSSGARLDSSKPIYDMAIDLASNIIYLPILSHTHEVVYSGDSTTSRHSRLLTLKTTGENRVISQMNATISFQINPYSMFPQMPEVSVTPAVDSWIDDTIIEIPVSLQDSTIVEMSTRTIDNRSDYQKTNRNYSSSTSTDVVDTAIGVKTTTSTSDSVVSEKAITYIRQREVTVEGHDFPADLDNIRGYFDGIPITLQPLSGTAAGTAAGTVKANSNGYVKAKFTIPANVLTGTREVLLKSDHDEAGLITEGSTLYIAQGIARTIHRTVTTLTTVLMQRSITNTVRAVYVDPVGQTFVLDRMTSIKGIDLYFSAKSDSTPVICEIRGVENGNITSEVYAHKSLSPAEVNISGDSRAVTRFNFDDPVLLEENREYAFVVRSTSDRYRLWVAELGGIDLISQSPVLRNSYMTGVMMSSSNNATWTAHQTMDIKFSLVEDTYALTSTAKFDKLTLPEFSRLYLSADSAVPAGTTVSWSYSLDGGVTYSTITPYSLVTLSDMSQEFSLKADLQRSDSLNLSPMIALDTISITASCYDNDGCYIGKNISGLSGYTKVKIVVDTYEPAGTSISVRVSPDNGQSFVSATKESSMTALNYGWYECTYNATLSKSSNDCRVFIDVHSDSKSKTPAFRRLRAIMSN